MRSPTQCGRRWGSFVMTQLNDELDKVEGLWRRALKVSDRIGILIKMKKITTVVLSLVVVAVSIAASTGGFLNTPASLQFITFISFLVIMMSVADDEEKYYRAMIDLKNAAANLVTIMNYHERFSGELPDAAVIDYYESKSILFQHEGFLRKSLPSLIFVNIIITVSGGAIVMFFLYRALLGGGGI